MIKWQAHTETSQSNLLVGLLHLPAVWKHYLTSLGGFMYSTVFCKSGHTDSSLQNLVSPLSREVNFSSSWNWAFLIVTESLNKQNVAEINTAITSPLVIKVISLCPLNTFIYLLSPLSTLTFKIHPPCSWELQTSPCENNTEVLLIHQHRPLDLIQPSRAPSEALDVAK